MSQRRSNMTLEQLDLLGDLLQQFREEQQQQAEKAIQSALTPDSAKRRQAFIKAELDKLTYIIRWVRAKYLNTPSYKPNHPLF